MDSLGKIIELSSVLHIWFSVRQEAQITRITCIHVELVKHLDHGLVRVNLYTVPDDLKKPLHYGIVRAADINISSLIYLFMGVPRPPCRIGAKIERFGSPLNVYLPFISETQDEKMYRVVTDRERWFKVLMGENYKNDLRTTERMADRIPFPEDAAQSLAFRLEAKAKKIRFEVLSSRSATGFGIIGLGVSECERNTACIIPFAGNNEKNMRLDTL